MPKRRKQRNGKFVNIHDYFYFLIDLVEQNKELINNRSKEEIKRDIEDILLHFFHLTKTQLILSRNKEVPTELARSVKEVVLQYIKGVPVAYLTHKACFFGYDFFVNEACLIPRIDSEVVIEKALESLKQKIKAYTNKMPHIVVSTNRGNKKEDNLAKNNTIKILDACCGSGCLGISLVKFAIDKKLLKPFFIKNIANKKIHDDIKLELTLLDISSSAMQVAKLNANKLLDGNTKDFCNVKYVIDDITQGFPFEQYDIIICNPPYIETNEIEKLDYSIRNFEPKLALDGGDDGLKFYRAIAGFLAKHLKNNGVAFFEIGFNQGTTARMIFKKNNFNVDMIKDYGKQDRCLIVKPITLKNYVENGKS